LIIPPHQFMQTVHSMDNPLRSVVSVCHTLTFNICIA
jgi:hypothetical protein